MSKPNAGGGQPGPPAVQKHKADNLNDQLGVIMVQLGRILKAKVSDQDRADFIVEHARKKMVEATNSFHSTLDDMEIEITRAKAVFLRDLELLRGKQQSSQAPVVPAQVAPPAPMVLDLGGFKPTGPSVPVAPMMGTGGSPFVAAQGIPKTEGKPVAPFPDMGAPSIPPPKPVAAIPFAKVKPPPVDHKRPSPKQTKQPTPKLSTPKLPTPKQAHKPAPKPNPASARMANKPNPMASAHKQAPKPPTTAPPAAPAVAPPPMAVAPAAPMAPVAAPPPAPPPQPQPPPPPPPVNNVPHFTNATFTLDPTNTESSLQSAGGDISLDMPGMDMDSFGAGESGDTGGNDNTMDDLDHFFDMGGDNSNADAETSNFNQMDEYMDFDFDTFN